VDNNCNKIKMTKAYLKKVISEEIYTYFKKNEQVLKESDLNPKDIERIFLENLEKHNGT
jgi:hypothetical protein